VETNIEAGIKYLSQMIRQFDREDYALAAYNGGPSRVRSGRPPLETLQYILNVGHYRNVLKLYESSIRYHAERTIKLERIREGDDWWSISKRLGLPVLQLRMHNPFLATRALRVGQQLAYPTVSRTDLFAPLGSDLEYRTRHGDNYLHLAFILNVGPDAMRDANNLWRLQTLPAGQVLRIPLEWEGKHEVHQVQPGEDLKTVADKLKSNPWRIVRDNTLFWDEALRPGMTLKVRPVPPRPSYMTHSVRSGETLGALARRYVTSVQAIQAANNLGRSTLIRIGQRLRIPTTLGN
jgi:LysM repeat protein